MSLSEEQREEIASLLARQIRRKLATYKPETNNMPFHTRLLGKDRMALFSFVQSINTMLGTSVFEQTAAIIARQHFAQAIPQYKEFNNTISSEAQVLVQSLMDNLRLAQSKPDKATETKQILAVAQMGTIRTVKRPRIDLFLKSHNGVECYFDLKTAKPNIGDFIGFKRMLLEWVGIRGAENPRAKVKTLLAIPYNPYEPEPYQRWTLQGLFDVKNEILVADEFWNFLGGKNTYEEVLAVFEQVGIALSSEIDERFARFD